MIGGGLIIAAAFAIMFPGLLTYAGGLMRVATFITVTLCIGFVFTFSFYKLRSLKKITAGGTPALPGSAKAGSTPTLPSPDTTSDT